MIPESIRNKMALPYGKLYKRHNHPLEIVKRQIYHAFQNFKKFEDFDPIVKIEDNFDRLLIPQDHPSRSPSDTYYVPGWNNEPPTHVLRTHTSAHQAKLLSEGEKKFLVTGDVYRRDEIDRCHYPVFHQIEGVAVFRDERPEEVALEAEINLKERMIWAVKSVFGEDVEYRFTDSYFPFTNPSWELEIKWQDQWLEMAGMGLIQPAILREAKVESCIGWAFGLGLERWAMVAFGIPDIRLFWSDDRRFLDQFKDGPAKFQPYSKYPLCYKDIAFWVPESYSHNDFYELVREYGEDWVESVKLTDEFVKPGKGRSYCYRVNYQSMDMTLTNEQVNGIQQKIRDAATEKLAVELR